MSFTFDQVDRFVAGTVGQPGERQFFLQVRHDRKIVSAALEKAQLLAMAKRIDLLTKQIAKENPNRKVVNFVRDDNPLETPVENDFTVGAISLVWNEALEKLCVELYAINEEQSDDEEIAELVLYVDLHQAQAFAARSVNVVNAGRLPCPFCAIPIDPRGHLCPRANGYKR